jgi:hypothetical protein
LGLDDQTLPVRRRAKQDVNVRFWPIVDIPSCAAHFCFSPNADISTSSRMVMHG